MIEFRSVGVSPVGSIFKPLGDEALAQVDIHLPELPFTAIDEFVGRVCRGNDDLWPLSGWWKPRTSPWCSYSRAKLQHHCHCLIHEYLLGYWVVIVSPFV